MGDAPLPLRLTIADLPRALRADDQEASKFFQEASTSDDWLWLEHRKLREQLSTLERDRVQRELASRRAFSEAADQGRADLLLDRFDRPGPLSALDSPIDAHSEEAWR